MNANQSWESSRRGFLRLSLAAAGTWGLARWGFASASAADESSSTSETLVGSNVYGWTQYFQREGRAFDVQEVMQALRDAGYDYLEGSMDVANPENNARFAEQLKAHELKPVSIYTGARLHEAAPARESIQKILAAAKICRQAGFRMISCNPDPIGREKTDEELTIQAAALNDLGRGLKELGLRIGVHHHLPEMASKAREFHAMFRNTDPDLVGFCYDVHWLFRGGLKPSEVLPEYGRRIVSWHLRQSRGGIWHETLDTGDVDYGQVADYAREHRLPRVFTVEMAMEQGTQITRSAFANHRLSREFVRKVFSA